ncbi:hypothetical protein [Falsiruegeria mediterranea]|jgi:hypothetical protein|uniref:hypothetical protein n=1 Tax=Falsiruegeria mediterranea TaxID=1280832 RepID=UPI0015F26742|nr:hypothetical protein [Falsiruegeria mediterranea]
MFKKAIFATTSAAFLAGCQPDAEGIEDVINGYNFIRLNPPTTLYQPGSLVHRVNYDPRDRAPDDASLGFLCNPKYSTDLYEDAPLRSETESKQVSRRLSGSFSVSPVTLGQVFNLGATAAAAKTVQVSLRDATVSTYALDDLARIRAGLGPHCQATLQKNIRKQNAYQIQKILTANVSFKVTFDTSLSAEVRAAAIAELGEIGATLEKSDEVEVTGDALIYGIHWEDLAPPVEG